MSANQLMVGYAIGMIVTLVYILLSKDRWGRINFLDALVFSFIWPLFWIGLLLATIAETL